MKTIMQTDQKNAAKSLERGDGNEVKTEPRVGLSNYP